LDDKEREEQGKVDFDIAVSTFEMADDFKQLGFDQAGDALDQEARKFANEAHQLGYTPPPTPPPMPLPGEQTSMGPISKHDEERAIQHGKDVESVRKSLDDHPEPHTDPDPPRIVDPDAE
jgi:hypothetical protein